MTSLFEQEVRELRPLRPRQVAAIRAIRQAIQEGHTRIVLQAPTGFGKTLTAAHIISGALDKGKRPLFTCPAITLVEQTLKSFESEGIHDIGIMQAAHARTNRHASLQIASVQTLIRRQMPDSDFAIVDEVHESWDGFDAILESEAWKKKIVIGLSATPWAKGMGLRWTKLIIAATIQDLIADGHATPAVIYGPSMEVNRDSVKVVKGEFEEAGSSALMSQASVVGDVLAEWKAKSTGDKTFMFCVNRQHAQAQQAAFTDAGIPFGYIDANTPLPMRVRIFEQMKHGEIAGIASVGCLIRGVDEDVRNIVDLQLTRSEIRHVQKWGRGVRCADGKQVLVGLDHAGNNLDLGLFTDIFHDSLDARKPSERGEAYKGDNKPAKPRKCAKCHQIVPPGQRACPLCGEKVAFNHGVKMVDGRLVEIGPNHKKEQQEWYSGLLWIARSKGLKPGWAAYRYKERFSAWPDGLRTIAKKPAQEIIEAEKKQYQEYRKQKSNEGVVSNEVI